MGLKLVENGVDKEQLSINSVSLSMGKDSTMVRLSCIVSSIPQESSNNQPARWVEINVPSSIFAVDQNDLNATLARGYTYLKTLPEYSTWVDVIEPVETK